MAKYYGVQVGKVPGVYTNWAECEAQVKGFNGAKYKSFSSEEDARNYVISANMATPDEVAPEVPNNEIYDKAYECVDYLKDNNIITIGQWGEIRNQIDAKFLGKENVEKSNPSAKPNNGEYRAYVDGSYNADTNEYGYAALITGGEKPEIVCGKGECVDGGRNVEGEVKGAEAAINRCIDIVGCKSLTVYHDYQGIGSWGDGEWATNKAYTKDYALFVNDARSKHNLKIDFIHVDGHTGVEGNEYVDKLAKMACGVPLTKSEQSFVSKLSNVKGYPKDRDLSGLNISSSQPQVDKQVE